MQLGSISCWSLCWASWRSTHPPYTYSSEKCGLLYKLATLLRRTHWVVVKRCHGNPCSLTVGQKDDFVSLYWTHSQQSEASDCYSTSPAAVLSRLISFVMTQSSNTDELSGFSPHSGNKQVEKNVWPVFIKANIRLLLNWNVLPSSAAAHTVQSFYCYTVGILTCTQSIIYADMRANLLKYMSYNLVKWI